MKKEKIIKSIADNDPNAIRWVYQAYRTPFTKWAITYYGVSEEDSKDLFQETIVTLVSNIQADRLLNIESSLKTYMFGIAKNHMMDFFRSRKKIEQSEREFSRLDDFSYSTFDLKKEEMSKVILETLEEIPDPCHSILTMFFLEGRSAQEIANKLHYKSDATVRVQKFRCLSNFREKIFGTIIIK